MYNANKIKTYMPILQDKIGPVCTNVKDALHDIVLDMSEQNGGVLSEDEISSFVSMFVKLTDIDYWIEGEYEIFPDYKIVIKRMTISDFENLPEFEGY